MNFFSHFLSKYFSDEIINTFIKKISFGFILSLIAIVIQGLAGLIILPLLLNFLSEAIVGLWILFISFTGLILLGQAGLSTLTTMATAKLKVNVKTEFSNFWGTVQTVYRLAIVFVIIICLSVYFILIKETLVNENFIFEGTVCWTLLSFSFMIQILSNKYLYMLNGLGEVGWDKGLKILVALINLFGFYIALKIGYGFISLGVISLFSTIVYYFSSIALFNYFNKTTVDLSKNKIIKNEVYYFFNYSFKIFILNISSYLVLNANFVIIEKLIGISVLPYYGGLFRITSLIFAITGFFTALFFPFLTQSYSSNEIKNFCNLYNFNIYGAFAISIFLSLILIIIVPILFPLWLGEGTYPGNDIFIIMLSISILYSSVTAAASAIIAIQANTFILPSVLQAILGILFSILLGNIYGLIGILIGNFIGCFIPALYIINWSNKYVNSLKLNLNK